MTQTFRAQYLYGISLTDAAKSRLRGSISKEALAELTEFTGATISASFDIEPPLDGKDLLAETIVADMREFLPLGWTNGDWDLGEVSLLEVHALEE